MNSLATTGQMTFVIFLLSMLFVSMVAVIWSIYYLDKDDKKHSHKTKKA